MLIPDQEKEVKVRICTRAHPYLAGRETTPLQPRRHDPKSLLPHLGRRQCLPGSCCHIVPVTRRSNLGRNTAKTSSEPWRWVCSLDIARSAALGVNVDVVQVVEENIGVRLLSHPPLVEHRDGVLC